MGMTQPTPSGQRHYCTSGSGYPHTSGDGRYSQATAERLFAREAKADAHTTTDPRFVVRWLVA
jgi:hypothetical protein